MLPIQGIVAATVAALSIVITLGFLFAILGKEKKFQALNKDDEH